MILIFYIVIIINIKFYNSDTFSAKELLLDIFF